MSYYNGDEKEFILPSPGIKIRLSEQQAREGAKSLRPQLFTGEKTNMCILCLLIDYLVMCILRCIINHRADKRNAKF